MSRRKFISPNMHKALQNAKSGIIPMGSTSTKRIMKRGGCTSAKLPRKRIGGSRGCGCGK
jgi:hypothetical protein